MKERLDYIRSRLRAIYQTVTINNREYFKVNDRLYLDLVGIPDFEALVIGYANSYEEAKNYMFEDGDLFDMELSPDEMLKEMLKEIAA